jgi:hypothetical protein
MKKKENKIDWDWKDANKNTPNCECKVIAFIQFGNNYKDYFICNIVKRNNKYFYKFIYQGIVYEGINFSKKYKIIKWSYIE